MLTADAPAKPKHETWLDWLTPGHPEPRPLFTREEVVDRTRKLGFKVSAGDLRYWEAEGVLPRAVKRWHGDATRALYPEWMPYLIASLRELQDDGLSLDEIAERLRAKFYQSATKTGGGPVISNAEQSMLVFGHEDLQPALLAFVRRYERQTGTRVGGVRVTLLDRDGKEIRSQTMLLLSTTE